MKHFLVTRFNLKVNEWKSAKDGTATLTEEWMDERFDLFQTFCLPSVKNQINQNFYWVVFFDKSTQSKYREIVKSISLEYKNFNPLFIDGIASLHKSLRRFILENIETTDKLIITSRLDNDDAIHQKFISTIQKLARDENEAIIDLRKGFKMDITNGIIEYRNYYNDFNPFISLIESSSDFKTIYSRPHKDWKNTRSIIVFDSEPLWIEVVHKRNMLNTASQKVPIIQNIKLKEFGINSKLKSRNIFYVFKNNVSLGVKNSIMYIYLPMKKVVKSIIHLFEK